ncbi:hypothetical protein Pcaca04_00530 [Pectobacterium carotovorum subsp. carotovorum]|nr:hypothetical protein Pcaca04_00530 [Pectobacterium carotovorum subsp. carotovorum]
MLLLLAVFAEASATLLLKYSDGFRLIEPGLVSFFIYVVVLFLFSHVLAIFARLGHFIVFLPLLISRNLY